MKSDCRYGQPLQYQIRIEDGGHGCHTKTGVLVLQLVTPTKPLTFESLNALHTLSADPASIYRRCEHSCSGRSTRSSASFGTILQHNTMRLGFWRVGILHNACHRSCGLLWKGKETKTSRVSTQLGLMGPLGNITCHANIT